MNSWISRFLAVFTAVFPLLVEANQDMARSIPEMHDRSAFVADGKVITITPIQTEIIPHPDGNPIVRKQYRAQFRVENILKAKVTAGRETPTELSLEYWGKSDARYKGDILPEIKVGDKFRLYAETISTAEDGTVTVFVNTANEVRPEAFDLERGTALPASGVLPVASASRENELPPASNAVTEAKPEAKSSEERPVSRHWTAWMITVVAIVGLLGLLKNKRNRA